MGEHVPHPALVGIMAVFVAAMALAAALFWTLSLLWPGGPGGLVDALDAGAVAVFGALHIPAAVAGILLLQWRRPGLPPTLRVALEAATLYFGLAVLAGLFLNYLLASFLDELTGR